MTSSRFILIFLGFIFLIIIILSSSRISGALQKRFGNIFPPLKLYSTPTPTPTIPIVEQPTPTPTRVYNYGAFSSPSSEIPATGPELISIILISGSFLTGISLKKLTNTKKK